MNQIEAHRDRSNQIITESNTTIELNQGKPDNIESNKTNQDQIILSQRKTNQIGSREMTSNQIETH
jgi:hypothetical protein